MMSTTLVGFVSYVGVRALVLGATGFIGRHVTAALIDAGANVTVAGRDAQALAQLRADFPRVHTAVGDVVNENDVAYFIRQLQPTITFNLIGYGLDPAERDEQLAHRINAELPAQIAALLRERAHREWRGKTLVHVGSAAEYGAARNQLREDTPARPTTVYGRTKLMGTTGLTAEAMRGRLRAITARLFTVYGPGDHPGRLLPTLLAAARTRAPLRLASAEQLRDFTYVGDAADGLLRLGVTMSDPGTVVNLATGRMISVREFVVRAARVLEIDEARLRFGSAPAADEPKAETVSIERLVALTRWTPSTTIETGVRLTRDTLG